MQIISRLQKILPAKWDKFPVDPASIDMVIITHTHIYRSDSIPLLVKHGSSRKIHCSVATFLFVGFQIEDTHDDNRVKGKHPLEFMVKYSL